MSWAQAQREVSCDRCPHVIQVGEIARFGDKSPTVWCRSCAKACLKEDPPVEITTVATALPALTAPLTFIEPSSADEFSTFPRPTISAALRKNILDYRRDGRMAATGERE